MLKLNRVTLEKIYSLCHSKEQLKIRYLVLEWIYFLFSGQNGVPRGGLECIYLAGCDLDIYLSSRRRYLRKEKP